MINQEKKEYLGIFEKMMMMIFIFKIVLMGWKLSMVGPVLSLTVNILFGS